MNLQADIDNLMKLLGDQKQKMDLLINEFNKSQLDVKAEIQKLVKNIETQDQLLTQTNIDNNTLYNDYLDGSDVRQSKINWGELVLEVFLTENKLMTSGEILKLLFPNEIDIKYLKLSSRLSSALYKLCDAGKISKYMMKPRKNYYGLLSWFEEPITPFDVPEPKQEYKMNLKKTHLKEDAF